MIERIIGFLAVSFLLGLTTASASDSPYIGTGNTVVLMVQFPDITDTPAFDKSYMDTLVFGKSNSLSHYLQENSYGKYSLIGRTYGWLMMPHGLDHYCAPHPTVPTKKQCRYYNGQGIKVPGVLMEDAVKIAQPTVDFSKIQRIILVTNTDALNCGTEATGGPVEIRDPSTKKTKLSATVIFTNRDEMISGNPTAGSPLQILIHEFGHNLGLLHAGAWYCGSKVVGNNLDELLGNECTIDGYADKSDPMGMANNQHYSAAHKELAGFLSASQLATATENGEYTLDQLEMPSKGYKAIKIPLGQGNYYSLEYRRPIGYDAEKTDGQPTDGVFLRLQIRKLSEPLFRITTLRPYNPLPLILNPGVPFADRSRDIKVEVLEKNSVRARIKISGLSSQVAPEAEELLGLSNTNPVYLDSKMDIRKGSKNFKLLSFGISGIDISKKVKLNKIKVLCNDCAEGMITAMRLYNKRGIQIGKTTTPVYYPQWNGLIAEFNISSAGMSVHPSSLGTTLVLKGDIANSAFTTTPYTFIKIQTVEGTMGGKPVINKWNAESAPLRIK